MAPKRHTNRISAALSSLEENPPPLDALNIARQLRVSAEALEHDLVRSARKAGHSWSDIGKMYQLTKQGAQQRFRNGPKARNTKARDPKGATSEAPSSREAGADPNSDQGATGNPEG